MTFLVWDPIEVMSLFDAMPVKDQDGLFHQYALEQTPLRLQLTIWQYDADIEIILWTNHLPDPISRCVIRNSPGIRVVDEKAGRFIEFAAPHCIEGKYDGHSPIPNGLRLWMEPQIRIETIAW